jgi:hypothetical protein
MSLVENIEDLATRAGQEFKSRRIRQTTIDFGSTSVIEKIFTIVDSDISATSKLQVWQSGQDETFENSDEQIKILATPQAGQMQIWAANIYQNQRVRGEFQINYLIG